MSLQLLQINYRFTGDTTELEHGIADVAAEIAKVPGLRWKIWLIDEAESRGGGCYLFDDQASALAYLAGPIVAAMKSSPAFDDVSVRVSDVLTGPSAITRAPLDPGC